MIVAGIDPGPERSAFVLFDGERASDPLYDVNHRILDYIVTRSYDQMAIEWVNCYGRNVGQAVFGTACWYGRFWERCEQPRTRMIRPEVCAQLVGDPRAKKPQVNAYLRDRFGGRDAKGTKKNPGPLYGVSGHCWDALAVAVAVHDQLGVK